MTNGCMLSTLVLVLLGLLLFPVSSGIEQGQPAPPPPEIDVSPVSNALHTQLADGRAQWAAQDIASYEIVVQAGSIWHLQTHTIVVRDGVVTDSSAVCSPAPTEGGTCEVRDFDPNAFTVPGLFARADQAVMRDAGQWTSLEIDPTYGFPSAIGYNNPDMLDEEWWWQVTYFEVLD